MKYLCAFMVLTEVQARIFAENFTLLCINEGILFNMHTETFSVKLRQEESSTCPDQKDILCAIYIIAVQMVAS